MPRDPHGPREDSGCVSAVDPGLALVTEMYNYIKQYHPRTRIMATAIRTAADATALSGLDFMVVPQKVLMSLARAWALEFDLSFSATPIFVLMSPYD